MPVFNTAAAVKVFQFQPGEVSCGITQTATNVSSGFRQASPELYWRQTPWMGDELYKLGQPWPTSFYSNDNSIPPGEADEWRVFQNTFVAVNDGSIHGTADITEADDTVSATGKLAIAGTLSVTEANDTLASAGTLPIVGMASLTEAGDTLTAIGTLALKGTASITEAGDTLNSAGVLPIVGTLSRTEADDTLSAVGALAIKGALSVVEQDDTLTGIGALAIRGTLSVTEADDTIAATGLMPIFYPRRGGWDERLEFERRQRQWEEDLRRIIDRSWRIANGEIDPITFEPIPPPDYSPVIGTLLDQALSLDRQRVETFIAEEQRRQEDDAIAILLLAA